MGRFSKCPQIWAKIGSNLRKLEKNQVILSNFCPKSSQLVYEWVTFSSKIGICVGNFVKLLPKITQASWCMNGSLFPSKIGICVGPLSKSQQHIPTKTNVESPPGHCCIHSRSSIKFMYITPVKKITQDSYLYLKLTVVNLLSRRPTPTCTVSCVPRNVNRTVPLFATAKSNVIPLLASVLIALQMASIWNTNGLQILKF